MILRHLSACFPASLLYLTLGGCLYSEDPPLKPVDPEDSTAATEIFMANGLRGFARRLVSVNTQGRITAISLCEYHEMGTQTCFALAHLTPAIGRLSELQSLQLENVPSLDSLPAEFWALRKLTYLSCSDCRFDSLPESLGNFTALEFLGMGPKNFGDTTNMRLRSLPESIGHLKRLSYLNLSFTGLRSLPSSLGQLESLKDLMIQGNHLDSLPATIGDLKSLEWLDASNNSIERLPVSMGDLASLSGTELSYNRIRELPAELGKLKDLNGLGIRGNPLEKIPEEIAALQALQILPGTLDGNRLCRKTLTPKVLAWLDHFYPGWIEGGTCN